MALAPGTRLGVYEVTASIGAGGMGQVWRARDTKLNRDVALKVLPDSFATDPDRLARFTREAQTLASLNHPNIAQIFGIESDALVMELVEGEELSAHIARGPIPLAEAVPIARQIADALEAAHERGIIHRDLKPANIKVRADGTVKVLDFGLAKAVGAEGGSAAADAMNSVTLEWADHNGARQPLPATAAAWMRVAVSPDGKLVAGTIRDSPVGTAFHADIWKYDIERPTLTKLTFEGSNDSAVWSRDGQWIAFSSKRGGKSAIYRVAVNGSGPPELLLPAQSGSDVVPKSWAPDGTLLYVKNPESATEMPQIWVLPPQGVSDRAPRRLLQTAFVEWEAQVSPDGKWVAYQGDESGTPEVYVVPFPGPGGKRQISTNGGFGPRWSRSGRELYYTAGDDSKPSQSMLMVVAVHQATLGLPQPLFSLPSQFAEFDVTPDPRRFLIVPGPDRITRQFDVITNWFEDLRRRVPIGK